ncbi:MAG: cytochrome-c peroxidase [Bacteroidetes bacterium]|nr:cytochrome-c peroxidase [Bacteroidota bacterium]
MREKNFSFLIFIFFLVLSVFHSCSNKSYFLPELISVPAPQDNPTTEEKAELGRKLFFDKRLSRDGTISCATCHNPRKAFTDQLTTSRGINGQTTERNSPSILNSGFLKTAMFDAHLQSLELQVIVPIQEKTEMGHNMKELIPQLRAIPEYQAAAKKSFNRDFDAYVLTRSISAFERTLVSMNSRYDQFQRGDKQALSKTEQAGLKLFTEKLYCAKCHPAPYFTTFEAENNGLYQDYEPIADKGRFRIHLDSNDIGKFKVPSLRNIELTFPYMHDGSMKTLEDVIAHYSKGGQKHPKKNKVIEPFQLSVTEQKQLIAFLKSLTDSSYLKKFEN